MTKTENLDLDPFASNIPDFASNISDEEHNKETELAFQQLNGAFENLDPEIKAWLEERKEAAKYIDPETAEIIWCYRHILDPYEVIRPVDVALDYIGRVYFACAPGSDIWVEFGDLPEHVREKIWERQQRKPAFADDPDCPF